MAQLPRLAFRITERGVSRVRDEEFQLAVIRIGRDRKCQLELEDPDVSRMHAVIEVRHDEVTIFDLGEGITVNGKSCHKTQLWHGDSIGLGSTTIELRVSEFPFTPYLPIDTTEGALIDALRARPDDVATRQVYADWLEQAGRSSHAAYLRLELDPSAEAFVAARATVLADAAAAGWRALVSRTAIANCTRHGCPKTWDALASTAADDVRSCSACSSKVAFCVSRLHVIHCERTGKPAATDPALATS